MKEQEKIKIKTKFNKWDLALKWICYAILLLYPMRHIHWGLDLWDTGYSYANFQYMGLEHMDSMWLYATYLANAVGNLLTKLPFAGNLVGMNFYTGLFVSGLAVSGFGFCTEKLQVPRWIAFLGEMLAISLCWCPTAKLYDYLTFVLFLVCVILLYLGLSQKRQWYLFIAGICLGTNVLVRFSNLPQAALIVGVWAYAVIEGMEAEGVRSKGMTAAGMKSGMAKISLWERLGNVRKFAWKQIWRNTLWCLGGYLAALVVLFGYIHIRYGLDNYIEGIMRLFAMTDNATDYKATSMIMGLVGTYVENMYWVLRIGVFAIAGVIFCAFAATCNRMQPDGFRNELVKRSKGWGRFFQIMDWGVHFVCVMIALVMVYWLYHRGFCSLDYYSYGAILWPGVTFLMLAMGIAVIRILHPNCPKKEKLICGLILLVVLLTSIGSNNKVYPSLNNLFIAAPFTLWECWRFITRVKEWRWKKLVVSAFPIKTIMVAFLGLFLFQSALFGVNFTFVEATGARQVTATVENNDILKGVKMHPDRAQWMQEMNDYVVENQLQGREVILHGEIPSLAYYLQMPPAFNSWEDLRSYSLEAMEEDLQETIAEMEADIAKRPVIIVENRYMQYLENGLPALEELLVEEVYIKKVTDDKKWELLVEFMEAYGYEKTFSNEKFTMYE